MQVTEEKLFTEKSIGDITFSHRIVMAPLTRLRSDLPGDVPNDLMAEYYQQRASLGGLIIAEATAIAINGRGYLGAPGIYTDEQVEGWKKVTKAVHAKGGKIFLQLWHVGRTGHADLMNGEQPISASITPYEGVSLTTNGWVPVTPNRAIEASEIPALIDAYKQGAIRAKAAGFDGVELHSANGYLLDQFLQDGSNKRTDAYGGSIQNRARLLLEVVNAVISVWGDDKVGVRLAPSGQFNGMHDSDPEALFTYVAGALDAFKLAYVHIVEPRVIGSVEASQGLPAVASAQIKKVFAGPIIAAGGFDAQGAREIVARGDADFVAFGRHFISNPDLPERIRLNLELNTYDRSTLYARGERGYTDYPVYRSKVCV